MIHIRFIYLYVYIYYMICIYIYLYDMYVYIYIILYCARGDLLARKERLLREIMSVDKVRLF